MKHYNASTSTDGIGGSAKLNPPGVPKVTAADVEAQAANSLMVLRRVGRMWQWWDAFQWRNGFQTNYLMLEWLKAGRR